MKEEEMELKEFIQVTLQQIVEGVSAAQKEISPSGAIINPSEMGFTKEGKWNKFTHAMPRDVEFDVGLTSTDKKGSSEGIGVFLGNISIGKKNDAGVENIAVTKVKFSVPLVLPPGGSLRDSQ